MNGYQATENPSKDWEEAAGLPNPLPRAVVGIAKHLSIILPSPGFVLREGEDVKIIKQEFHSLFFTVSVTPLFLAQQEPQREYYWYRGQQRP